MCNVMTYGCVIGDELQVSRCDDLQGTTRLILPLEADTATSAAAHPTRLGRIER